jgi:hypothetical protein
VNSFSIIGDSKIIIRHMVYNSNFGDYPLSSIIDRIKGESKSLISISFFHLVCEINNGTNRSTNYGAKLKVGDLMVNGTLEHQSIP